MLISICNRIIEYSFYALFLLVPLVLYSNTSELFEFNKMWLTFGLTIIIGTCWVTKIIVTKRFFLQRTLLDIPIGLFLLSQLLSTLFSWDLHISLWGYYSRFNGGLFSIFSYIFLYYAFVSNFQHSNKILKTENLQKGKNSNMLKTSKTSDTFDTSGTFDTFAINNLSAITVVKRILYVSLFSGVIVTLWGLPSHFGYDPTCYLFRGTFDVSCWTDQFQPKIRIFSTLGQPNWMGAYLSILLPLGIALWLTQLISGDKNQKQIQNSKLKMQNGNSKFKIFNFKLLFLTFNFALLISLFYLALLFTDSRSGFLGLVAAIGAFFFLLFLFSRKYLIPFLVIITLLFGISLYNGTPLTPSMSTILQKQSAPNLQTKTQPQAAAIPALEGGGTNSSEIRKIVWQGAIDIWKDNPLIGTGVETFAFAYYKYKPQPHNLTSEWDYLYNKAHNEYLNYLATTGGFGLGSYLLMIGIFLFIYLKNHKLQITNHKQIQNTNIKNTKHFETLNLNNLNLFGTWNFEFGILPIALIAAYISILVSNFFGFSVVILNLYLFMIPAFVFVLLGLIDPQKVLFFPSIESKITSHELRKKETISMMQAFIIFFVILASLFMILLLFRFWSADKAYALGYNLNRVGEYEKAYIQLKEAVSLRPSEPVFQDELAVNQATIATLLLNQKDKAKTDQEKQEIQNTANNLAKQAVTTSTIITTEHPYNIVFWKSQTRLFYTLAQVDQNYLAGALNAITKAYALAPTDAKIAYNAGVLYGQTGNTKKGMEILENTTKLKPDYRDAYYALGLFYHEMAVDKKGKIINQDQQQKAISTMQYILNTLGPDDKQAKEALKTWGVEEK